jgi:ABC-type phosphate transport system substrate-binding protein
MRYTNLKIAAAVAVAIGAHSAAEAAQTPAACAAATVTIYIAGSSAAQPAFATALAADLFDAGGETVLSGTNGNFKAYCGAAKAGNGAGIATGTVVTAYYRGEGGSVVGALPIAGNSTTPHNNNVPVKFLDLTGTGCAVAGPATTGTSAAVGTTDGWGGCVTTHVVEMGVTDLEPTVFVTPNYPSAYSATVFGTAVKKDLSVMAPIALFQQTFALYVNSANFNGVAGQNPVNISRETAAAVLSGAYTNWNQVPNAAGNGLVSSTSSTIHIVNREAGSGTRTGATIYFLGTNCVNFPGTLSDPSPLTDGYATGDVLTTAAATAGSITYASIDNSNASLTKASLSGVAPSNLAAATGQYDYWFEATANQGKTLSAGATTLFNWLTGGELQSIGSAPHADDVLAIPNAPGTSNTPDPTVTNTISTVGGHSIYINPYTKGGNSCSIPAEQNN